MDFIDILLIEWKLPHFEKMLYDQALISLAYVEAFRIFKDEKYKEVAEKIFEYVDRELKSEKGHSSRQRMQIAKE